jgi:hypothetical protein
MTIFKNERKISRDNVFTFVLGKIIVMIFPLEVQANHLP